MILAALAVLLLAVSPALAADVFQFTEKNITVYEGESLETALRREGEAAEGEVTYTSANERIATVAPDGTVTGVAKGQTRITASVSLSRRVMKTQLNVKVEKRVTKVTLDQIGRAHV